MVVSFVRQLIPSTRKHCLQGTANLLLVYLYLSFSLARFHHVQHSQSHGSRHAGAPSPNAQRVDDTDRSRLPSAKNTLPAPAPASAPAHEDLLEDEDEYAFDEDPDEEEKEECNYDADEETVLKYAFGNDTTDLDDYERFVMKPQAHPQVRKGMKKFAQQVIQAVRQNGLLEDPKGHFFTNLQPRRRIHAPVVYTILEAEQEPEGPASLKKGGQTSNPTVRHHYKYSDLQDWQFRIVTCIHHLDKATDDKLQEIYNDVMEFMMNDPSVPGLQRAFFKMLREYHGECYGPKKKIIKALLEKAVCDENGLGSPFECFMCDEDVYDSSWNLSVELAEELREAMAPLQEAIRERGRDELYLHLLNSWATGWTMILSSKIEATKCLVGDDNYCDTLPIPVYENPETSEQGWSKDFSDEAKEGGRQISNDTLDNLLATPFGVELVDLNRLITNDDPNSPYKSIHDLVERRGFVKKPLKKNKMHTLYVHRKSDKHYVIVHSPLHIPSDSQEFIPNKGRVKGGISLTSLKHVTNELRGLPKLRKDQPNDNPMLATYAFQMAKIGMQQFGQVCAMYFRQIVSKPTTNAIEAARLRHLPHDKNVPIVPRLRIPDERARTTDRRHEPLLMIRARCMVTQVTSGSDAQVDKLYKLLDNHFGMGASSQLKNYRWTSFVRLHVVPNSPLEKKLKSVRDSSMQNTGNRTKNRPNQADKDALAEEFQLFKAAQFPANDGEDGPLCFLWTGNQSDNDKPPVGSRTKCGRLEFPGRFPYYKSVTNDYVRDKCKNTPWSIIAIPAGRAHPGSVVVTNGVRSGSKNKELAWKLVFIHKARPNEQVQKRKKGDYPTIPELE